MVFGVIQLSATIVVVEKVRADIRERGAVVAFGVILHPNSLAQTARKWAAV
jgi:hypothetical protein